MYDQGWPDWGSGGGGGGKNSPSVENFCFFPTKTKNFFFFPPAQTFLTLDFPPPPPPPQCWLVQAVPVYDLQKILFDYIMHG